MGLGHMTPRSSLGIYSKVIITITLGFRMPKNLAKSKSLAADASHHRVRLFSNRIQDSEFRFETQGLGFQISAVQYHSLETMKHDPEITHNEYRHQRCLSRVLHHSSYAD